MSFTLHAMRQSFCSSLIPLSLVTFPTYALELSVSVSEPPTNHIIFTDSWKHAEEDLNGGSLKAVDDTHEYQPRVLSSFLLPTKDSGSFGAGLGSVIEGAITAQAVDSRYNIFATSNTISSSSTHTSSVASSAPPTTIPASPNPTKVENQFATSSTTSLSPTHTSSAVSSSSPITTPTSPTPTKMEDQTGSGTTASTTPTISGGVGNIPNSASGETSTNPTLAPALGVSIPILFLIILLAFFCFRRRKTRKTTSFTTVEHVSSHQRPDERSRPTSQTPHPFTRINSHNIYSIAETGLGTPSITGKRSNRFPFRMSKPLPRPGSTIPSSSTIHQPSESHIDHQANSPILPFSPEPLLPPPPLTPLYLKRMTPDVPVDLDDEGNSLRISRWKQSSSLASGR